MANNTRLLDSALSTFWYMTEDSFMALKELYFQAISRGGTVNEETMAQIMQENEELGLSLHMQSVEALATSRGNPLEGTKYGHVFDNGVAVIDLIGPIYPRANMMTSMSGATSIAQFTNDFVKAYSDPSVKAIVMNVDSPGGDVRGIGDAANLIHKISSKGKKPVKSFASGFMASAAYYIGSVAREVVGSETSMTGSIGVVLTARAKDKGQIEIVSSQSPYKRPDPSTEEGFATLREHVDDLASVFIKDVAKFRGVSTEKVMSDYGQGMIKIGTRAKKQGLLDRIGTLASTVEDAASEAENKRTRYSVGAIGGASLSILQFTEEDTMGFTDLINKFKSSDDTTSEAEALDASQAEESDESADASNGQEEQGQATVPAQAQFSREELEERFADSAELFAVTLTTDSKIYPAQQAHAASDLLNARIDDTMFGGTVKFVDENGLLAEGTREAAVRARYQSLPKHTLAQQQLKAVKEGSVEAVVLSEVDATESKEGPISEERKLQLLKTTELGQRVIAAQK